VYCFIVLVQNSSYSVVTAALTVLRLKGRFSVATVDWMLIGQSSNLVLSPRNGTLTYLLDQPHHTININISGVHVCTFIVSVTCYLFCLQCFDTVGWAPGRASGL